MPIPPLDDITEYLPAGNHEATLDEVEARFGSGSFRRRELMDDLRRIVGQLHVLGVDTIWIDGSFVTGTPRPQDVDMIYVPPPGAAIEQWGLLAPRNRLVLKKMTRIDLWPHPSPQPNPKGPTGKPITLKELFETDRDGVPKGHVLIRRAT